MVYVIENLGKGVPPTSRYQRVFHTYKQKLSRQLINLTWNPMTGRATLLTPARNRLNMQRQLVTRLVEEQKAFLKRQLILLAEAKIKQDQLLKGLVQDLAREDKALIGEKLRDPQPLTRWLAIQVAAKKRLPFEQDLIPLLADPQTEVRQAAHQALVRLSRGNDFGPLANATSKQVADAQRRWQQWLDLQNAHGGTQTQADAR